MNQFLSAPVTDAQRQRGSRHIREYLLNRQKLEQAGQDAELLHHISHRVPVKIIDGDEGNQSSEDSQKHPFYYKRRTNHIVRGSD